MHNFCQSLSQDQNVNAHQEIAAAWPFALVYTISHMIVLKFHICITAITFDTSLWPSLNNNFGGALWLSD